MNLRHHLRLLPWLVLVVLAAIAGSMLMNRAQRSVQVLPGERGCVRLEGSARQTSCLAKVVQRRVDDATRGIAEGKRAAAIEQVVDDLDEASADQPVVAANCHQAMHRIGRREGVRAANQETVPSFPRDGTRLCTAGYVHGLAEGYLNSASSPKPAEVYPVLCADAKAASGCAHGIGHALLRAREWGTPTAASESAASCLELPVDRREDCTNGVYMELAIHRPALPTDEFVSSCQAQSTERLRVSCLGYITDSAATNDLPLGEVRELCTAETGAAALTCIEAWGRDLGVREISQCGDLDAPALATACIRGAIELQVASGHVAPADARTACATLPARLRNTCRDEVRSASA